MTIKQVRSKLNELESMNNPQDKPLIDYYRALYTKHEKTLVTALKGA